MIGEKCLYMFSTDATIIDQIHSNCQQQCNFYMYICISCLLLLESADVEPADMQG